MTPTPAPNGTLVGYVRVSSTEQNLDLQLDALRAVGCTRVFSDTASGAKAERPGLNEALSCLRPGDALVVWRLDRLGRSLAHRIARSASWRSAGSACGAGRRRSIPPPRAASSCSRSSGSRPSSSAA